MTENKTTFLCSLVLVVFSYFICLPCFADNLLNNTLEEVKDADSKGNTDSAASYLFAVVETAAKSDLNDLDNRKALVESTKLAVNIATKLERLDDLAFVETLCKNELYAQDLLHGSKNDKAFWQARLARVYTKEKEYKKAQETYAQLFCVPANQKLKGSSFYVNALDEYPILLRKMGRSQEADLFKKTHPHKTM